MERNLIRRFHYNSWANRRVAASLASVTGSLDRPRKLLAHILNAERIWLDRLHGEPAGHPWEERSLEDCRLLLERNAADYEAFLATEADPLRMVDYKTSQGVPFRTSVGDILEHVLLHGPYHRGQIAAAVALEGGTPAMTDFILYTRDIASDASR